MASFSRRAGIFIRQIVVGANEHSFVTLDFEGEQEEDARNAVHVLRDMGYLEVVEGEHGNISVKLTDDGIQMKDALSV